MAGPRTVFNPVTGERFVATVPGADAGGAYTEARLQLPPGGRPPGIHRHARQDEHLTVVTGRIRASVGGDEREFGPGESVLLPKGVWHDFWVLGDEPAEVIGRATPALGIELLIGTLAGLARDGRTDRRGRPRPLQGAVIGEFYAEVAQFRTPPPAVQRAVLPVLAAIGRARGLRPYYERHFEPGEIEAILGYWAAHRPWAGNRPPGRATPG